MRRGRTRIVLAVALLALLPLLAACEKKDASHTTSPSAESMIGTTLGRVAYGPAEAAPAPVEPPEGWQFELGNVRFEKLENGTHALIVIGEYETQAGQGMEIWLSDGDRTVAQWLGGSTRRYSGVVCWQQRIESDDHTEALPLEANGTYTLTVAFRDPANGEVVLARQTQVRNQVPSLSGEAPDTGSEVFRDLLGCPRGS